MKQKQGAMMADLCPFTEDKQLDYAARLPLADRQKEAAAPFQRLDEQQDASWQWVFQFDQLIDTWEGPVFQALNQLAQLHWPTEYVFGLIPVNIYRLRDAQIDEAHLWWVEYDMTTQDQNQCAVYYACLALDNPNQPALMIQSGTNTYFVNPLTIENLRAVALKAGQDPPLIIPKMC